MTVYAVVGLDVSAQADPDVRRDVFFQDDTGIFFGRLNLQTTSQAFGRVFYDSASNEFRIVGTRNTVSSSPPIVFRGGDTEVEFGRWVWQSSAPTGGALLIGDTVLRRELTIQRNYNGPTGIHVRNTTSGTSGQTIIILDTGGAVGGSVRDTSVLFTPAGGLEADACHFFATASTVTHKCIVGTDTGAGNVIFKRAGVFRAIFISAAFVVGDTVSRTNGIFESVTGAGGTAGGAVTTGAPHATFGVFQVRVETAINTNTLVIQGTGSAVGNTAALGFVFNNSTPAAVQYAAIAGEIQSPTAGSHTGDIVFYTTESAVLVERGRIFGLGTWRLNRNESSTATALEVLRIQRTTTGAAAAGIGVFQTYFVEDDGGTAVEAARVQVDAEDAAAATFSARMRFHLRINGTTAERFFVRETTEGGASGVFDIVPTTDNTGNIGVAALRWTLVRAVSITSGDLNLEDGEKSWTLREGLDEIFAINNRTKKKYRVALEEVA